jgi:hypothetical protein
MSGRKLAVQRQQILARVNQPLLPGPLVWRWAPPAAAAASLLAAVLFLSRPTSPVTPPPAATATAVVNPEADAQLFTDVYSMEQDVEPRAAAPIRGLFQETSFEPVQESPKQ